MLYKVISDGVSSLIETDKSGKILDCLSGRYSDWIGGSVYYYINNRKDLKIEKL